MASQRSTNKRILSVYVHEDFKAAIRRQARGDMGRWMKRVLSDRLRRSGVRIPKEWLD